MEWIRGGGVLRRISSQGENIKNISECYSSFIFSVSAFMTSHSPHLPFSPQNNNFSFNIVNNFSSPSLSLPSPPPPPLISNQKLPPPSPPISVYQILQPPHKKICPGEKSFKYSASHKWKRAKPNSRYVKGFLLYLEQNISVN